MVFITSRITAFLALVSLAIAGPIEKRQGSDTVTYLGTQGSILCKCSRPLVYLERSHTLTDMASWRSHNKGPRIHCRHSAVLERNPRPWGYPE